MKIFVLCSADPGTYKESLDSLRQLEYHPVKLEGVHPVHGIYDILVIVEVDTTAQAGEFITDFIKKVPGISRTVSLIEKV